MVESQYISCPEDVEKWVNERQMLQNQIANLEVENNFLKMNMAIQEQYILKIQGEVEQYRKEHQHPKE